MTASESVLFGSNGRVFSLYAIHLEACTVDPRTSITLSGAIQYVWPHPTLPIIYVATSTLLLGRPNPQPLVHELVAVRHEMSTGNLAIFGPSISLPYRPVHASVDPKGADALVAYNDPGKVDVFAIGEDGQLGALVDQRPDLDFGVYPHQVRVTPDGSHCIVVARGNPREPTGWWAALGAQDDPGAVKVFRYRDGVLEDEASIALGDGLAFGPRHLDFHPNGPWAYLSIETQNEVAVFARDANIALDPSPIQRIPALADPDALIRQVLGPVHVHPRGHVVYFTNRVYHQMPDRDGGQTTIRGVENSIVVYAIDSEAGTLSEIQRLDTEGINARSFTIDPSGSMLVIANSVTQRRRVGEEVVEVSKNLATFAIGPDGRLELRHLFPQAAEPTGAMTWVGIVAS